MPDKTANPSRMAYWTLFKSSSCVWRYAPMKLHQSVANDTLPEIEHSSIKVKICRVIWYVFILFWFDKNLFDRQEKTTSNWFEIVRWMSIYTTRKSIYSMSTPDGSCFGCMFLFLAHIIWFGLNESRRQLLEGNFSFCIVFYLFDRRVDNWVLCHGSLCSIIMNVPSPYRDKRIEMELQRWCEYYTCNHQLYAIILVLKPHSLIFDINPCLFWLKWKINNCALTHCMRPNSREKLVQNAHSNSTSFDFHCTRRFQFREI